MALENLTDEEKDLVRRCLVACADGPFFEDAEFATLFGMTRDELRAVIGRAPWPAPAAREVVVAISSAFGNLLGHPHRRDEQLAEHGVTRAQIEQLSQRWLQA